MADAMLSPPVLHAVKITMANSSHDCMQLFVRVWTDAPVTTRTLFFLALLLA